MSRNHECPVRRALAKQLALADPGGRFGWTADGRTLTNGDVAAMLDAGDPLVDDLVEDCYGALARVFRLGGATRVVVVEESGRPRHVLYCGEEDARALDDLVREANEARVHGRPEFRCDVYEPSSFARCRVELEAAIRDADRRFVVVWTDARGEESVVGCFETRDEADADARRCAAEFSEKRGRSVVFADGRWRVETPGSQQELFVRGEGPEDAA